MTVDEKECPFCAEKIKAAAIKCRFCNSDLPNQDNKLTSSKHAIRTPTRIKKEEGNWVVWALVLILVLGGTLLAISQIKKDDSHPGTASKNAVAQIETTTSRLQAGSLYVVDSNIILFSDQAALNAGIQTSLKNDPLGIVELVRQGRAFIVHSPTEVMYLEFAIGGPVQVRVYSGEHTGQAGWLLDSRFLHPILPATSTKSTVTGANPETSRHKSEPIIESKIGRNKQQTRPNRDLELSNVNDQISAAFDRDDLEAAVPLYKKAIAIIRKTGSKTALSQTMQNYNLLLERIKERKQTKVIQAPRTVAEPVEVTSSEIDAASVDGFGTSGSRAMGNIAPYRRDMLMRIAGNWHPKYKSEPMITQVVIGRDGSVLSCEVVESSGNRAADKQAVATIEATEFAPLPGWYKGEQLSFKIDSRKIAEQQ